MRWFGIPRWLLWFRRAGPSTTLDKNVVLRYAVVWGYDSTARGDLSTGKPYRFIRMRSRSRTASRVAGAAIPMCRCKRS